MRISTLLVILTAVLANAAMAQSIVQRMQYRLVFPSIALDSSQWQAMDELHFTVSCGHVESISWVPEMWNVEIVRAVSAVEEFRATAGLGAARLSTKAIEKFSGAITITTSPADKSCFRVSGGIIISGGKYFEVPLSNDDLHAVDEGRK